MTQIDSLVFQFYELLIKIKSIKIKSVKKMFLNKCSDKSTITILFDHQSQEANVTDDRL